VFIDVDSIALGEDFRHILRERLDTCDLMLTLIGPGWLDAKNAAGSRRLESATDLVRQEIAAALKRNIPVIPVLLQGAQMPPAERLPDDIKELVYRNGFELGHSTWESDVREMFTRLGLDKRLPPPTHDSISTATDFAVARVSRLYKTSLIVVPIVVVAILAAVLLYQSANDQSSGNGVAAPSQQPSATSPRASAGSPAPPASGLGAITVTNLKTRKVEVYDQSSSGSYPGQTGYVGTISPTATTLQVPAGTYKLKFDNLFVEDVVVTSTRSPNIVLGTVSVPKLARKVEVYDQSSSGDFAGQTGYVGTISPPATTLEVPPGVYKLKFGNLFVPLIRVEAGKIAVVQ
jgi:hypothetical protein